MALIPDEKIVAHKHAQEIERKTKPHAKAASVFAGSLRLSLLTGSTLSVPLGLLPEISSYPIATQISVNITNHGRSLTWPLATIELSLQTILDRALMIDSEAV